MALAIKYTLDEYLKFLAYKMFDIMEFLLKNTQIYYMHESRKLEELKF